MIDQKNYEKGTGDKPEDVDIKKVIQGIFELRRDKKEIDFDIKMLKELAKSAGYKTKIVNDAIRYLEEDEDERNIRLSKANEIIKAVGRRELSLDMANYE